MVETMHVKQSSSSYGDGFISAADLLINGTWQQVTVVVSEVFPAGTVRAANKQLIERPVLAFKGAKKRYAPCKIACTQIQFETGIDVRGEHAQNAVGKKITLYPVMGPPGPKGHALERVKGWFGIDNLAGVRVRIWGQKPKPRIASKDLGIDITGETFGILQADVPEAAEAAGPDNPISRLTAEINATDDTETVWAIMERYVSAGELDKATVTKLCQARNEQLTGAPF